MRFLVARSERDVRNNLFLVFLLFTRVESAQNPGGSKRGGNGTVLSCAVESAQNPAGSKREMYVLRVILMS